MNEGLDTLYAKWVESNHTINLHPGEGSVEPTTINVVIVEELGEIPIPEGFDETKSFLGWYADSSFENVVTSETIVTGDLINLYTKIGIQINENGYNYWAYEGSGRYKSYSANEAPDVVYPSYTYVVNENEGTSLIRTTYVNGSPTKHEACLYYNNKLFCMSGNYFYDNGARHSIVKEKLKADMEEALGVTPRCYTEMFSSYCHFESYSYECAASDEYLADCSSPSNHTCSVYSDGSITC